MAAYDLSKLKHSGVLGQKWGIRNYQYKDGTYTPEGKKRRRKSYESMSNEELQTHISRKRMEREAYQLDSDLKRLNPEKVSLGKKFLKKAIDEAIVPATINVGRQYLEKTMKQQLGIKDNNEKKKEDK